MLQKTDMEVQHYKILRNQRTTYKLVSVQHMAA